MKLIGLMSGTSVDGIDAALIEVSGGFEDEPLRWRLDAFRTTPWPSDLRTLILDSFRADAPLGFITALNYRLGEEFAKAALDLIAEADAKPEEIEAICSHGQTVWHLPEPMEIAGSRIHATMQLGESAVIADRTGCVVVSDFRAADIAAGGQGAPLVPFVDQILFSSVGQARVVQNIGGIANLTYLPPSGLSEECIAFDTGPGNALIDLLVTEATNGALDYDRDGSLASQGTVIQEALAWALEHSYFAAPPPKSCGRETFGVEFAARFRLACEEHSQRSEDVIATATALTAKSIAMAYRMWLPSMPEVAILGGGGVHNATLRRMLVDAAPEIEFRTHADFGVPDDAKEAIAFAILGYHTLHGMPSNLPSATGARKAVIQGKITLPHPAASHYGSNFYSKSGVLRLPRG